MEGRKKFQRVLSESIGKYMSMEKRKSENKKSDNKKAEVKSIKLDQIKSLSSIDID